jgi:F-type H+-transporting ATPase subunit c
MLSFFSLVDSVSVDLVLVLDDKFLTAFKYVGAGSATISMAGSAIGIGIIFGALIVAYVRNPAQNKAIFNYAIFGFALTEALALFGLMMAFLILFS